MMEIKALIDYNDFKLNRGVKKGEDIINLYKKANIELDEERIKILLDGNKSSNYKPFIETRKIEIIKEDNNEDASNSEEKPKAKNKRSKK